MRGMTVSDALKDRMEELAEKYEYANSVGRDPLLLFAGDPPMYDDRLPDTWDVCEQVDEVDGHRIVKYRPRAWKVELGTFTLHDGTMDDHENGDVEFSIDVEREDYVAYNLVNPMLDDKSIIETTFYGGSP